MTNQTSALAEIQAKAPSALLDRAALAHAVALVASVVERKYTIPILANLLLQGDGAGLSVRGTDLDIEITARIDGAADSDFSTTIPAHLLKDILGKAKASDMAAIDLPDEGRVDIDLGGIKFKLQSLPVIDFPDMAAPVEACSYAIAAPDLIKGFDRVSFAISTDETRYYLNGAYMHFVATPEGNFLRMVATDGRRLATFSLPAMAIPADLRALIVPRKTIKAVLSVYAAMKKAKRAPDVIQVDAGKEKICFTLGDVRILSKVIDGTFPDYERCIPRDPTPRGSMNVKAFDSAVEQVQLISQERGSAVRLTFSDWVCRFEVNNPGSGSSEASIPNYYCGVPLEAGFNSRYLRDLMAEIEADEFTIAMNDAGCPAVILDPSEPRFMAVLMATRV